MEDVELMRTTAPKLSEQEETALKLFKDIEGNAKAFTKFVDETLAKINSNQLTTSNGLSFLELKNLTMLNYLIDLAYVIYRKCQGQSIQGNAAIERLVEARTVLEKMKPINYKLKYRIDKMVKIANTGTVDTSDPLHMKPRPEAMLGSDEEEDGSEMDEEIDEQESDIDDEPGTSKKKDSSSKEGIYKPPKVSAVHYDDDEDGSKERALQRAKRRAMSTSVIRELRDEFDDAPEEIAESSIGKRRQNRQAKERERYEEEYLVRLNVNKKQKAREREDRMLTISSLGRDLTHFENVSALDHDRPEDIQTPSKRPRKSFGGGSSKGKKSSGKKKKFSRKFKKH